MDFLARRTACGDSELARALLVNASLSDDGVDWRGRTTAERKLDAAVWNHRQLYVVANSNSGSRALGNMAAAKNSLSVGAVHDSGDIASLSSHGPTADGRLAPLVVGTGVEVRSARGGGRRTGYAASSGTSMSSPSVAGVAALLMDAVPAFREQPAAVRARLMASAIRPDPFLDDPAGFPPHNGDGPGVLQHRYGLGKVSARTALLVRDAPDGWTSGATVVEPRDGEYAWHDIDVPPGASRLDIAMTWDERPADTLVQSVLNDLDLWVDRGADCPPSAPGACGDAASRSTRDNVEWLILRDPPPGVYRLKAVPKRAHVDAPRVGLAWTVIRGPSTPQLAVAAGPAVVATAPGEPFELGVSVSVDGYVAAGTMLRVDCRAAQPAVCSRVRLLAPSASSATRQDAVARSLEHDADSAIALGEVAAGEEQEVDLVFLGTDEPGRFRLHFTATSWNGKGASTSVEVAVGASDTPPPAAAIPPNDDYARAERLTGGSGSRTVDLLLATPEPGEPPAVSSPGAPSERPRSVWYAWTAPDTDTFRFSVDAGGPLGVADELGMDLFESAGDDPLAGLRSTGLKVGGGLTFAAVRGQDYRLRIGLVDASFEAPDARRIVEPLTLRWSPAALPPNDAFGQAARIGGALGTADGSNLGASVEAGEHVGPLAATTWFRWLAPATGDYAFSVDRRGLAVAAFTGNDVAALRLVSGFPDSAAVFPARAGDEYRVVVAARGAYASGNDYTLRWAPGAREGVANDDLMDAEPIPAGAPFHTLATDLTAATVQPREPAETGVRSAWWRWTAPADGFWTWRARRFGGAFRMSVFRIDPATGFVYLAGTDPDATRLEFSWEATAGTHYFLSVGAPLDAPFGRPLGNRMMLEWGRSPANDSLGAAAVLAGAAGSVTGSNAFATIERGEDATGVGDSSLWWTWEAPSEGWYRFSLAHARAGVLAVFRRGADGGLERLAISRRLYGSADAVFRVEAGATYVIRVGTRPPWPGEGFELSWEAHGVPAWLRFVDLLEDGDLDAAGTLVQVADPRAMIFHPDGGELYAATADGLQVYARDADSGGLRLAQTVAGVDNDALLLWDEATRSLLAGSCQGWDRFARSDGAGLTHAGAVAPPSPCPEASAFTDATGALLLLVRPGVGLETYRFDAGRTAIEYVGATGVSGIGTAIISNGGEFVYAAADNALHAFALNPATGALQPLGAIRNGTDAGGRPVEGLSGVRALAIDTADTTLFAFGSGGAGTAAFDLAEPGRPRFLDALHPFTASATISTFNLGFFAPDALSINCGQARARPGRLAVDVVCPVSVFTVQLASSGALRAEDDLVVDGVDRFDGNVPDFSVTGGVAASPDGRHLYAGLERGFVILERTPAR